MTTDLTFHIVQWVGKYGSQNCTRVFSHHVDAFSKDVSDSGGYVIESYPEGN